MSGLLLAAAAAASAAAAWVTPELDREALAGIDAVYSMDFDGARRRSERMKELVPGHPFGDFGLTVVGWARYMYETERGDDGLLPGFEAQVKRTVETARAWIASHPDDAVAHMVLGSALGIQGHLQAQRRQYVRAYLSARAAMKGTRRAVLLDPGLEDAYLGLGMYDYYTDLYPRMIRPLAKVILRGDRARGLAQIRRVAEKGHWARMAAKMVLVDIHLHDPYGARDPAAAAAIMDEVRARYPRSAMLHSAQLIALYQAGRIPDFHAGAAEFVGKAASGEYRRVDLPKGYVLLGTAYWAMSQPEAAVDSFLRGAEQISLNRWAVWAAIRAGNVLDLLGRREEAMLAYGRAVGEPDRWGYKEHAESGLRRPFRLAGEFTVDPP